MTIQNNRELHKSSYWNYLIPGVAATAWVTTGLMGIAYAAHSIHDYTYPNNPKNPELVERTVNAVKFTLLTAGSTIPFAAVVSIAKATCICSCTSLRDSFNFKKLSKPEAIFANTVAAPLAMLLIPWALTKD